MNKSDYCLDKEEAEELADKIELNQVTDEQGNIVLERVVEKLEELVQDREPDPKYYKGMWINSVTRVERALGKEFNKNS